MLRLLPLGSGVDGVRERTLFHACDVLDTFGSVSGRPEQGKHPIIVIWHEITDLIVELMDAADEDGDGTVDQAEFVELLLRYRPRRVRVRLETMMTVAIIGCLSVSGCLSISVSICLSVSLSLSRCLSLSLTLSLSLSLSQSVAVCL